MDGFNTMTVPYIPDGLQIGANDSLTSMLGLGLPQEGLDADGVAVE